MKQTRLIMGMPITIWLPHYRGDARSVIKEAFDLFRHVDEVFSTFKPTSAISQINAGGLKIIDASSEVQDVLRQCEDMKQLTHGFFDIRHSGQIDPSGLVKGWSIKCVGQLLDQLGVNDYSIDAGGDILLKGHGPGNKPWSVGIRLPSNPKQIAKKLSLTNLALATSGLYERGEHIWDPHTGKSVTALKSVTVIGPDMTLSDVLATALFAMGRKYNQYLGSVLPRGYEAYIIEQGLTAQYTHGFSQYVV